MLMAHVKVSGIGWVESHSVMITGVHQPYDTCSRQRTVSTVFVFRLPHVDQSISVHGGATPMDYNEANSPRPPQNHKIIVSFSPLDSSPLLSS
jgi:hypothetical protein